MSRSFLAILFAVPLLAACPPPSVSDAGTDAGAGPVVDAGPPPPLQGVEGAPCYANATCNLGLACEDGVCVDTAPAEGALNGPCYPNDTCDADLVCASGTCVAQGAPDVGELGGGCYPNNTCNDPYTCLDDATCGFPAGGEAPVIVTFAAGAQFIEPGATTTLTWSVLEADACTLDGAPASTVGFEEVTPSQTTDYTLYCSNAFGEVEATILVQVLSPVTIQSFTVNTNVIDEGLAVELTWQTTNAVSCEILPSIGSVPVNQTALSYVPVQSEELTLSCKGVQGPALASLSLTVSPAVSIVAFAVDGAVDELDISSDQTVIIEWFAVNATSCSLDDDGDMQTPSVPVSPQSAVSAGPFPASVVLSLSCEGVGGPLVAAVDVNVNAAPVITSFDALPSTIDEGGTALLTWSSTAVASCVVTDGDTLDVPVASAGYLPVSPAATTSYDLTCANAELSEVTDSLTVTVTPGIASISLAALTTPAIYDEPYNLSWDAPNATSCSLLLPGGNTIDDLPATGQTSGEVITTTPPTELAVYTLQCVGPGEPAVAIHTVTVDEVVFNGDLVLDNTAPFSEYQYNRITGDLTITGLSGFGPDLRRLFAVEGDITVVDNSFTGSVDFRNLRSARTIAFTASTFDPATGNPGMGVVDLPSLETTEGLSFSLQSGLPDVLAPGLTLLDGDLTFFGTEDCGVLDFSSLQTITGELDINFLGAANSPVDAFPELTAVQGTSSIDNHSWASGELDALESQVSFSAGLFVGAGTVDCQ